MSLTSSAIVPNPWARILDALEKKVNRHSYDTWLKPTRYSHASNGVLFVRIPTAEFRHVGDKYADLIQEAVDVLGLGYEDVKFVTACGPGVASGTGTVRLGQRRATESALHVRRVRDRQWEPVRTRGLPGGGGAAFESLQPA